jgi:uncharacterized cupin superfamily protein
MAVLWCRAAEPGAMAETNGPSAGLQQGRETNMTATITVEHQAGRETLQRRGVFEWEVWTCDVSEFPWRYSNQEVCYFTEGEVVVTPKGGKPVSMGKGDLVTFPAGMECTWKVIRPVRKHYMFE